jgi:hypothetical protein
VYLKRKIQYQIKEKKPDPWVNEGKSSCCMLDYTVPLQRLSLTVVVLKKNAFILNNIIITAVPSIKLSQSRRKNSHVDELSSG